MKPYSINRNRGQALVEMALILPIIILFLMFVLDLGRAVYYYSAIYNAAREGSRYGIIYPNNETGIESAVKAKAIGLDQSVMNISVTPVTATSKTINVQVSYSFQAVTPLIWNLLASNPIVLHTQSTMQIER